MSISSQSLDDGVIPEDYFSFDSILAEQQKIACVFKKSMFGLGRSFFQSYKIFVILQKLVMTFLVVCKMFGCWNVL